MHQFTDEDILRFESGYDRGAPYECWNWKRGHHSNGYGAYYTAALKPIGAHRVSLELKLGAPIPKGMLALHSCDNRSCVNPNHLRPGSYTDNVKDAMSRNRHVNPPKNTRVGSRNHLSKLNEEIVLALLNERATGVSLTTLGHKYGLNSSSIWSICAGKVWQHVHSMPGCPDMELVKTMRSPKSMWCIKGSPRPLEARQSY